LYAIVTAGILATARGQDRHDRAEFMQEKLRHSKDILEGLTREDYSQIRKGACALKSMNESHEWAGRSRPEAVRFRLYSLEFEELLEQLIAKADQKNIDGATLAYLRLTMNCVNCHKELRSRHR